MMVDTYLWLKALHVTAAMTFVSGVLGMAVFLNAAGPDHAALARQVRRCDQRVTTPAMVIVWALGLSLALMGGWLRDGWLTAKFAFVVVLSGVHGVQSARLRRMAGGLPAAPASSLVSPLIIGAVAVIAVLAIVKPI